MECMDAKQKRHQLYRSWKKGCYHLCTDGWKEGRIFNDREEFRDGMAMMGLASLKYDLSIYAFELMPNHLHILLSASGSTCVDLFGFIKWKLNMELHYDGYPPLPESYDFKLIPIDSAEALRKNVLYLARNPYEKGYCLPGGHLWGSSYLLFNQFSEAVRGIPSGQMPSREINRLTGSLETFPSEWEIHPELGVLPRNFVHTEKIRELFSSPKDYLSRLVKDYESFVSLSDSLGEEISFSSEEVRDIVSRMLRILFPEKSPANLSSQEKCRAAVELSDRYRLSARDLSLCLRIPEHMILQTLRSKDYGKGR